MNLEAIFSLGELLEMLSQYTKKRLIKDPLGIGQAVFNVVKIISTDKVFIELFNEIETRDILIELLYYKEKYKKLMKLVKKEKKNDNPLVTTIGTVYEDDFSSLTVKFNLDLKIWVDRIRRSLQNIKAIKETVNLRENEIILNQLILNIEKGSLSSYFKNKTERKILLKNFYSLRNLDLINDYKYGLIAMGSILEYLLGRYCLLSKTIPTNNQGKILKKPQFFNYIETAIHANIFSEEDRWRLIQDYLRDFRNYVHIEKEIDSKEIDEDWYNSMIPAFQALVKKFQLNN